MTFDNNHRRIGNIISDRSKNYIRSVFCKDEDIFFFLINDAREDSRLKYSDNRVVSFSIYILL